MRGILFIVILLQGFLFAKVEIIPFVESGKIYDNHPAYTNVEFYTKNTHSALIDRFLGLIVKDFKVEKKDNGEYNISINIHNYSSLIGSLDVYDKNSKLLQSYKINAHELPNSATEALIKYVNDLDNIVSSFQYFSLNVARDDIYQETSKTFSVPSKDCILKLSLNSEEAIYYNMKKYFIDKAIDNIGGIIEIDSSKLMANFLQKNILDNSKSLWNDGQLLTSSISSDFPNILETIFEGLVSNPEAKLIKKSMDIVISSGNTMVKIQNMLTFYKMDIDNQIVGPTLYIKLSEDKENRGFWGTNSQNDMKKIISTRIKPIFSDIPNDSIYYIATRTLYEIGGVIKGYNDGTFRPYNPVTRAQLLKMVLQMQKTKSDKCYDEKYYQNKESEYNHIFADINVYDWYAQHVFCAFDTNIANGYILKDEVDFLPNKSVNRAEAYKIISNGLYPPYDTSIRKDESWWIPYKEQFKGLVKKELLDDTLVGENLTRGQTAQLIYGICLSGGNLCKQLK